MAKTEIRMTGSGGQGVIMGTIIIAEAAYADGKQVVQCQAYGPEARGGSSKAETIVSDKRITYTKVSNLTCCWLLPRFPSINTSTALRTKLSWW